MEVTLEKIELIKDRTGVSYRDAKEALENANGSVVDAIIDIEESIGPKSKRNKGIFSKSEKLPEKDIEEEKKQLTFILNSIVEDPSIPQEKKVFLIIHSTSLVCAIVAVQPLPFADIAVLTPIQLLMVNYLNKALGNPYEKSKISELLTSLLAIVGWGLIAQHLILGAYKTVIPFVAGVTTLPLVYAATWALGTAAKIQIEAKKNDRKIGDAELKKLVQQAREDAKKEKGSISIASIKKEISDLNENAREFEDYKTSLQKMEEKLEDLGIYDIEKSKDEIILGTDIGEIYQKRFELIDKRIYSKYNNLTFSDQIKNILALLPPMVLLGEVEQIIGQINYDISKLSVSKPNNSSNIREISTNFGTIYVILRGKVIYLQYIELNDDIRSKVILIDYIDIMKVTQNNKLLRDQEIREILIKTFKNAQEEIDIISPWANRRVMDSIRLEMQTAISRGVKIKVIYGIGDYNSNNQNGGDTRNINTERVLNDYAEYFKSSNGFVIRKGNTHIKLLICDSKYYVQGSYNFLSFDGSYNEDVRSELALYSESTNEIQELKRTFFSFG